MIAWSLVFEPRAEKDLQKLSGQDRVRFLRYLAGAIYR